MIAFQYLHTAAYVFLSEPGAISNIRDNVCLLSILTTDTFSYNIIKQHANNENSHLKHSPSFLELFLSIISLKFSRSRIAFAWRLDFVFRSSANFDIWSSIMLISVSN